MRAFGFPGLFTSRKQLCVCLWTAVVCGCSAVVCPAEDYILLSRDAAQVQYYQEQKLAVKVLVEDICVALPDGTERMFAAGDFVLSTGEGEVSEETRNHLASESRPIDARQMQCVPARPLASERTLGKPILFADVDGRKLPNFSGSQTMPDAWLNGNEYLDHRYCPSIEGEALCVVDALTGKVLRPLYDRRAWEAALKQVPVFEKHAPWPGIWQMNSSFTAAWINTDNDLYYAKLDGSQVLRLTHTPEAEELVEFSPDGNFISYVAGNNLWVVDVRRDGIPRALTTDGSATLLNGKSSWVYYEEVYSRDWKAYWWSPDSRQIIFYRSDESVVPTFTLIDEVGDNQRVITTRYPRAGEPNPRVTLGVVNVSGSKPRFQKLRDYDPENYIVARAGFTAKNEPWYIIQDRAQRWSDFWINGKKAFRDSTPTWIEPPLSPLFLGNGDFILTSTRDGFCHVYLYSAVKDGGAPAASHTSKQLTSGDWEVRSLICADEVGKWAYFTGTRDNLIGENLYRVNWESGLVERLTWEPGAHSVSLSSDCSLFADSWSNRNHPGNSTLRKSEGGAKVRILNANPVYAIEEYNWGKSEQFSITLTDGYEMEAAWILPPDFDPGKKYPVWVAIYGGPEMPSVRDNWAGGRTSDQSLATEGIIAFYADPRVASGKGAKYAWPCYRSVYVSEGSDLAEAIRWLGTLPFVDSEHIGISGYSYGGSMTLWMMTRYDLFCAGIAGGSVTSERDYDSIYTERYMDTPQNNPEGYEISAVIAKAADLHGRLLIVHGQLDDNVHPANTWKFVQALQNAGIQYEQMVYPRIAHAYGGSHHYQLMREFIRRNLIQPRDEN